jgi:hypothetical protein
VQIFKSPAVQAVRTVIAVSTIALLPTISWQILDARSSVTVAAPMAPNATRQETIVRKSKWTWSHRKSDRVVVPTRIVHEIAHKATSDDAVSPVQSAKADREAMPTANSTADAEQFSDWLVRDETGISTARITDFASRKSNVNRNTCQARHDAIVSAFSISNVRVMADKPVMFQSSICAANGEIVITCFGTTGTVSPRKARVGGRCSKHG